MFFSITRTRLQPLISREVGGDEVGRRREAQDAGLEIVQLGEGGGVNFAPLVLVLDGADELVQEVMEPQLIREK